MANKHFLKKKEAIRFLYVCVLGTLTSARLKQIVALPIFLVVLCEESSQSFSVFLPQMLKEQKTKRRKLRFNSSCNLYTLFTLDMDGCTPGLSSSV